MSLLRRRTILKKEEPSSFDIGDANFWIAATVGGGGSLIPGEAYRQLALQDARTDLYGKSISYSSGYQIYVFYYAQADGTGGGGGSGWSSVNPYPIAQQGSSVRILFKTSSDPEDIETLIKPKLI